MRVLHLFANHKLTGPAELALETARAVADQGVDVQFFSSRVKKTEKRDRWVQLTARERGVPEAEFEGVRLPKHISPFRALLDVRKLKSHLRADPPDLIHCHSPGDHLVAGLSAGSLGIPIVRSLYDGVAPKPTTRGRLMFGRLSTKLVCHSLAVAETLKARASDYNLDPAKLIHMHPPVDVVRFDPGRGVPSRREALGVPSDAFCVGIVARMQTHRRFELLLEAIVRAKDECPNLHVVVVGRGTNQDRVGREPVKALGLSDRVHFSGYVSGEDYVGTLASFDAKVFLVPGSDGTCRAVREALAMGLPVITTRRGILPELAREGVDGLLIDETPESLQRAFVRLARDPDQLHRMGQAARAGAVERFAYQTLASRLVTLYEELLAGRT